MTRQEFDHIVTAIPTNPGIYKYYGEAGEIIYIGKAKNLRKRVSSYFSKTFTGYKTYELVNNIRKIEFTIVNTEQDAFLLENSLIKEFQPKYNINLKDDKSYPFIIIKNEPFPRVFLTRKKINDGSEYLGPFTSVAKVRELIEFIRRYIPLRTCKLNLTETNIKKGKFKVCLEYHLGNCKGPCAGLQNMEEYNDSLLQVRNLLKGNLSPVIKEFKSQMQQYAANLEFEKAAVYKNKLEHLEQYEAKSTVVNPRLGDLDVFSFARENDTAYVNYLMVNNGAVIQTHTIILENKLEESDEEVLLFAIAQLRDDFKSTAAELIVPFNINYPGEELVITVPKAGDKKKLLELSEKNTSYFKQEQKRKEILHITTKSDGEKKNVLYQLQEDLQLQELPVHIECFDNSNFQGSYPVSAMVCFKNGVPSKKDYRHFNIKTVEGINDFASMKEVVHRRYSRLLREQSGLPQLIIIDGGKGQLSAAMESITDLGLQGSMTVVGLAKNEEEIFFPGDTESLRLPINGDTMRLIRYIRDEVHRFGITFHRQKRSKGTLSNQLEQIKGIGKATADLLLKEFKSVAKIKALSVEELTEKIGPSKAAVIKNHFTEDKRD
ncbi:MAG: excinuclease ABC subunit UvrC [Sphingobacteriales bacterium]|nr:excinuclease ABC subunit UvrC [Sphingobacteriales bacterium]MBI3720190.1 excinuclease ABC subunit UvrC [Sphingobacteriales bacterium]